MLAESDLIASGWLDVSNLIAEARSLAARFPVATYGIDAPRMPLPEPRQWYWRSGRWVQRAPADKGQGRHCEVVISAHRIANPQWTRQAQDTPQWMHHGFALFETLGQGNCHEVFPTASYKLLSGVASCAVRMDFSGFEPGPKDMIDAIVAAVTVREYLAGRGQAVGNGDGLGCIILPRPIVRPIAAVLEWPGD